MDHKNLSPGQINDLYHAMLQAVGDDVRHEAFIGHPQPTAGCCYVTSAWLAKQLGGHVGTKDGHFFHVSPNKEHVLDLTGDWFAYPPVHESRRTPEMDPQHLTWRPGPAMYKRADHPLYKGFRVLPEYPDHQRAKTFARRADAALRGHHVSDLLGPTEYSGETPQKKEEWDMASKPFPMLHDEPQHDPTGFEPVEYKWIYTNGQLHVSPVHGHEELLDHAGGHPESEGPSAVGYVTVTQGHALWEVDSNVSMRGIHDILENYSDTVGWKFDGMVGSDGSQLHEDFGPKMTMWYAERKDGHLVISKTPLPDGAQIRIKGKTAFVKKPNEALEEWAGDFGYKLAEYPGGGDMTDKMKKRPNLDTYNRGDPDFQPERNNPDLQLGDNLRCGECGEKFDSIAALGLHHRDHEPLDTTEIEDGHFPQIDDFDAPMPFRRTQPSPNQGETIAKVVVMPLPNHRYAARFSRFDLYANISDYNHDDNLRFYGAYHAGQLVGYGVVRLNTEPEPEVLMGNTVHSQDIGIAILATVQRHFDSFFTHDNSEGGEALMRKVGMANVRGHRWRWAKGQAPKDMLEESVPFVYDIDGGPDHKDGHIAIGYPGQSTSDIPGRFTPGGIVEGYYEPGGKVLVVNQTNMPWTVNYFARLWYALYPQMEITSVEMEGQDGKTQKLAADSVGNFLKTLASTDQAVYNAWQALREAGGKVYVVGGAVRDALRQEQPKDIDLMVAGIPADEVDRVLQSLPGRVDLTGKRFGVYRYRTHGQEVEVALPRQDKYETSRRGEGVITVDHGLPVEKDLERRDFTANSMAVDLDKGQLIDPYGGSRDIEKDLLRTTHPDSFREDPTRLVRALVAHGRFGLQPDEQTREEMASHGHMLRNESPDALNQVLTKLFSSHNPAGAIRLAQETGVLQHLFPEVAENWDYDQNSPHHNKALGEHLLHVLDNTAQASTDPDLRLAALYHDTGKPASAWTDPETGNSHYYQGPNGEGANHEDVGAKLAHDRMRALNYPVARINRVQSLIQGHMFPSFASPKGARKFLQKHGENADDLLTLRHADMYGKGQNEQEIGRRTPVDTMHELVDQARHQQAPTDLQNLSVNGNDLISMGVQPGPQIGNILRQLVDDVVADPSLNDRNALLNRAQQYANAQS